MIALDASALLALLLAETGHEQVTAVIDDCCLSLGDRACLALARTRGVPAMTSDRTWTQLQIGIEIRLIR